MTRTLLVVLLLLAFAVFMVAGCAKKGTAAAGATDQMDPRAKANMQSGKMGPNATPDGGAPGAPGAPAPAPGAPAGGAPPAGAPAAGSSGAVPGAPGSAPGGAPAGAPAPPPAPAS